MFTGIVEKTGKVISLVASAGEDGKPVSSITQLIVDPGNDYDTKLGDSVAINGCCLTVTNNKAKMLAFDVSSETLSKTSLGALKEESLVNLERAARLNDRLGGHLVLGHVDDTATVEKVEKAADGWYVTFKIPVSLARYIIPKGSITLDGISLTVNDLVDKADHTMISVMLIPTTVSLTNFKELAPGKKINVEVDIIGKYLERLGKPADSLA